MLGAEQRSFSQQRVDGFGAEGVMLPSPSSLANRSTAKVNATVQRRSAASPELAGVAQPSPAELTQEALRPMVLPALFGTDGRLLVPAALRGTREILMHQNLMADQAGLERIRDEEHLRRLYAQHQLVMFSEDASLRMNPELPWLHRTARPWTVRFAADTAHAFYDRFHQPLQVNSAVRTVVYQLRLQRSNGNAAAIAGETASPHLTGQALDFGKRGMSLTEIAWMRAYLLPLMMAGRIDVEEEFQQACFHISVYRSYTLTQPSSAPKIEVAGVPATGLRPAREPSPEIKPSVLAPASIMGQQP